MARQNLTAVISADARQFNRTMRAVGKTAGRIGRGLGAAGAAGAAALAGATVQAVNYGDSIDKAAKRTGITAETFQKLSFSAELSGSSAADVEKAIKRMSTAIGDAQNGLAESVRDFDALGVSMDDLKGKTPDQQLTLLLKKLASVTDATKRAELAQGLFGRSGTSLIPIISKGAEGFDKLFNRLEAVGGVLSGSAVAGAASLKDAVTELFAAIRGVTFKTILGEASTLQDAVDGLTARIIEFQTAENSRELRDNFASIVQLAGLLSKAVLGILGFFFRIGNVINDYIIQPIDELADKIIELADNKIFGNLSRRQQLEAPVTLEEARRGLGFSANAPGQATAASMEQTMLLRQIATGMAVNNQNTGAVAGAVNVTI